jgi:uroporphyrinogen-III synthase
MSPPLEASGAQLALLHRISHIVSSDHEIESILEEMVAVARNITRSDACLVYVTDFSTNEIVLRSSQPRRDEEIGTVRMKMGEGTAGWVAANNSVVALASRASSDARFKPVSSQENAYEAVLSVPLIDGGNTIGVLNVHHTAPHRHSGDEVALVTFIGEQMGGLIARARLSEKSQTAVQRMKRLAAVAHEMSTGSYLVRILQGISEMVADTLDSPVCSILLVDDENREMTVGAARCSMPGSVPDYITRTPIRVEGSLVDHVIRHKCPIVVSSIHNEKQYRYPELASKAGLTSLLATPLTSQGRAIGSINVYTRDRHAFSEDEIGFIKVVAGQVSVAIRNARLMSEAVDIKRTIEARKLIERAKRIIQRTQGVTEEQAYLRLRNTSSSQRRSMRDLAEAVILAEILSRKEGALAPDHMILDQMSEDEEIL